LDSNLGMRLSLRAGGMLSSLYQSRDSGKTEQEWERDSIYMRQIKLRREQRSAKSMNQDAHLRLALAQLCATGRHSHGR